MGWVGEVGCEVSGFCAQRVPLCGGYGEFCFLDLLIAWIGHGCIYDQGARFEKVNMWILSGSLDETYERLKAVVVL